MLARTAGMDHILDIRLQCPPGGELRAVARLDHAFVIGHHERPWGKRVNQFLATADVVADLQIGTGNPQRVIISAGYKTFVNEASINSERCQIAIFRRPPKSEKPSQSLMC